MRSTDDNPLDFMFGYDFDDGNLAGWTIIDKADTISEPAAWSRFGSQPVQKTNIGSDAFRNVGTY